MHAGAPLAPAGPTREFWVRNGVGGPASFRRATATLSASGSRSLLYVEDKLSNKNLSQNYIARLKNQLERDAPSGAYMNNEGLLQLAESIFGPLPQNNARDNRLIVLFADLGSSEAEGDFHDYDLASDADAQAKQGARSNEANLVYVNGFRETESHTGGVLALELQRLLSSNETPQEPWLAESIGEGAVLLSGYFEHQNLVDSYLQQSGHYPLVTSTRPQLGPQLLFSSFLLDTLPSARGTAVGALSHLKLGGRDAIEKLYQELTHTPLNFDAIFSNFVSYVFDQSAAGSALPSLWRHTSAVYARSIAPYFTFPESSGELLGELAPFSFVAVDLAHELSPTAQIQVSRTANSAKGALSDCAQHASILWKPVTKTRIAVYALGCDPSGSNEAVQFRLKILDQPSLYPLRPITLVR